MILFFQFCNFFSPSCPICNSNGEPVNKAYIDIGAEDIEAYLVNHRDFLAELANRVASEDADIFDFCGFGLRARINQEGIFLSPIPEPNKDEYEDIDMDDDFYSDESNSFMANIPHLRLNLRVNEQAITILNMSDESSDETMDETDESMNESLSDVDTDNSSDETMDEAESSDDDL